MATQTDQLPVDATKELSADTARFPDTLERPIEPAAAAPAAPAAPAMDAAAATDPPRQPNPAPPPAASRPSWWALGGAVALAIVIAAITMWWLMAQRLPDIDPQQVIARNLADAEQALSQGRYIDPAERSALHYYSTVLALAPDNAAALAGLDTIAQRFITDARVLLADRRIAEAGVAMEKARRVRPDHEGLAPLEDQLRIELRRLVAATQVADDDASPATGTATAAPATTRSASTPTPASDVTLPSPTGRRNALPQSGETVRAPNQTPTVAPAIPTRAGIATTAAATATVASSGAPQRPAAPALPAAAPPATSPEAPVTLAATRATPPTPDRSPAATAGSGPVIERQLVRMVQPTYPQDAAMRGLEGWVDVRMQIDADGRVMRPRVVQTQGGRVFNRPALQAVQQWQYDARPGAQLQDIQVRIEFKLAQ